MEITGTVISILQAQEGTGRNGNPWKSQSFVIETEDQYPRKVVIEIFGEDRIKQYLPEHGDKVTASIDIESHEFNGRWYTTVKAYRVSKGQAAAAATQQAPPLAPQPAAPVEPFDPSAESTEPPF